MKKIVALLTARGNNTMKDKNVRIVSGKPLLYWPAMAAKNCKYISDFYVSSDDLKILDVASQLGYKKIQRPNELAQPNSQHVDAIKHAMEEIKKIDELPDVLVVLLGNSATIKSEWISDCVEQILKDSSITAVVPVVDGNDHHPYRAKTIDKDGFLKTWFDFSNKKISTNRQDLPQNFFLCHNFWVLNIKNSIYSNNGQAPWYFMGNKIKPYVVDESFDVHDENDILLSEIWLKKNNIISKE